MRSAYKTMDKLAKQHNKPNKNIIVIVYRYQDTSRNFIRGKWFQDIASSSHYSEIDLTVLQVKGATISK